MKLIGLLSDRIADPKIAAPHLLCRADETDAILAAVRGAEARPQSHAGLVLAWPRDEAEYTAAESELARHASAHYRTREVLHWDELGEANAGAVVLVYLVRRRADLSLAAFEAHYRERHAPLARIHHPGIARYVQNFIEPGDKEADEVGRRAASASFAQRAAGERRPSGGRAKAGPCTGVDAAPIDAISELWFRSEEDARTRFYRDEESTRVIGEDVRRFIDLRSGTAIAVRPRAA